MASLGPLALRGIAQVQDVSPFLPPNAVGGAAGAKGDAAGLELRGVMSTAQGTRFCIYDPSKKIGRWVSVNQGEFGFTVQSFDSEHDTIIVIQDGRRLTLALRNAKVAVGVGMPMGLVPNGQPGLAVSTTGAVLRPTPEDEQKRLQAIAEEVRRRRLQREQGSQTATPNVPRQQ